MPEPLGDLRPYLVQVLNPLGTIEGTGFLCHPDGFVLTCWHVLESWRQLNKTEGAVRFGGHTTAAQWIMEHSDEAADVAVLKLTKPEVRDVPYLPLDVHWRVQAADPLVSFGYPKGQFAEQGISIGPKLQGLTPTQVDGVTVFPLMGFNLDDIDSGYSGAPVVNTATQKVIGLVHAKRHKTQAFIVPLAPLFARWPELRAYHDVFERIRKRIGDHAQARLAEKLHASQFIALNLELGTIPERGESRNRVEPGADPRKYAHGRRWDPFNLKQLVPPRTSFILSSDVGTGKTVFVYWLASELVKRTRFVPFVMTCDELERRDPKGLSELCRTLVEPLCDEFLPVDLDAFLAATISKGELTFLFDGLDQVPSGKPSVLVKRALSTVGRGPVLFTSRPSAVLAIENDPKFAFLRLQPFSSKDQRCYFGARYTQARAACVRAPNLTRVPMLAFMVRELVEAGQSAANLTRTELYSRFIDHILSKHEVNRPTYFDRPDLARDVQTELRRLAFDALAAEEPKIQKVPESAYPKDARVSLAEIPTFGLLNRIVDKGENALFFTHQSFQEFLAAQYVADKPEAIDRILTERWHPKWAEVIRFLAGLKGEPIVEKVVAKPDNVIHANLFLAADCAGEVPTLTTPRIVALKAKLYELAEVVPFRTNAVAALRGVHRGLDASDQQRVLKWLRDDDWEVCDAAVEVLKSLGDQLDAEALCEIAGSPHDKDWNARRAALEVLGSMDVWLDAETMHKLVGWLIDPDSLVRLAAVEALGSLDDRLDAEALQGLVGRLQDEDWDVRHNAVAILKSVDDRLYTAAIDELMSWLKQEDYRVRGAAVNALGLLGDRMDGKVVRELVKLMRHEFIVVLDEAVQALESLSERLDAAAIEELTEWLHDEDGMVRAAAARILGSVGERLDREVIDELVKLLGDDDVLAQMGAVKGLARLGRRLDDAAIGKLLDKLGDGVPFAVRTDAVYTLASLSGRLNTQAVRRLLAQLRADHAHVRFAALDALCSLGVPPDGEALRDMLALLRDENSTLRWMALKALDPLREQLDADQVCEIVGWLDDKSPGVRQVVVRFLSSIGQRLDAKALGKLVDMLRDPNPNVRQDAVLSVASLGRRLNVGTVRELIRETRNVVIYLRDNFPARHVEVVEALAGLSDLFDTAALGEIAGWLRDENPNVRKAAVRALRALSERLDAATLRALVARLRDENLEVRLAAAEVLGAFSNRVDGAVVSELAGFLGKGEFDSPVYEVLRQLYHAGVALPVIAT